MKRILIAVLFLLGLFAAPVQAGAVSDADVIWWWAPVIYQRDDGRGDPMARENIFTTVNYDLDWRGNNNWENLPYYPPSPAVYYSLVESDTHYFLGYYLYYPRHTGGNRHEHDMTGVMAVVQKNDDKYGKLELLLIYNNDDWTKVGGGHTRRDNGHPILVVSAGAHEIANERAPGPAGAYPQPLTSSQSAMAVHGGYKLVDLQEFWQHRDDTGQNRTFNRWGYFDSDTYINAAAPWAWDYRRTNWLAKPAEMLQRIHGPKRPVKYLNNPYGGI